jgi:hypothetical protein
MREQIINLGIAKIRLKPVEEKKMVIVANCPFCDKNVKGSSRSQIEWNLALHVKQKHKDNKDAEIFLKQLEEHNET